MAPDPIPTSLITVLIIAVTALAGTVGFLFRHFQKKLSDIEGERRRADSNVLQERLTWAAERSRFEAIRGDLDEVRAKFEAQLRAEFEGKHRMLVEDYAKRMEILADSAREHEDTVRREFAQNMELVATKAGESTRQIAQVLDKLYDRFVSPRSRMKG